MSTKDQDKKLENLRNQAIKTAVHYDVQAQIESEKEFEEKRPEFERLSARFGPDLAYDILQGEFYPGMTMEMICEVYKIEYPLTEEFRDSYVETNILGNLEYQAWELSDDIYYLFSQEIFVGIIVKGDEIG